MFSEDKALHRQKKIEKRFSKATGFHLNGRVDWIRSMVPNIKNNDEDGKYNKRNNKKSN